MIRHLGLGNGVFHGDQPVVILEILQIDMQYPPLLIFQLDDLCSLLDRSAVGPDPIELGWE
jgi:hypothetical protein